MWSNFTLSNYDKIKLIKKKYIDINSLFYKETYKKLEIINSMSLVNEFKIEIIKINQDLLKKMMESIWVYENLINNIDDLDVEYLISWNNNKIYLKCKKKKFDKILNRLPHLLRMINYIKNNNKEKLVIYLLLSKLKKKLDNDKVISPKNINTGYTNTVKKYIFIWREEEFEKVLFHEIMHFYDYDHRHETYNHFLNFDSLYEAINDVKAIIINLIYLYLIKNKKLNKLNKLMDIEFSFINNQAIMINYHINNKIKLNSPAFSYYVLKAMLINYITCSNFLFSEYNKLFNEHIEFNKIISKLSIIDNKNFIDFYSCRMTFLELE
jgi:hypothetical protein